MYEPNVPRAIEFIAKEFEGSASVGTLNSCRSAIALLHGPQLGEDARVQRFFKGLANLRPAKPKYDTTWDPQLVLDHISSWGSTVNLTLERLTFTLVSLCALITAHRIQTLALIDIRNIEKHSDSIRIKIPGRIKTSRVNKTQPTLFIPYYKQHEIVCLNNRQLRQRHSTSTNVRIVLLGG